MTNQETYRATVTANTRLVLAVATAQDFKRFLQLGGEAFEVCKIWRSEEGPLAINVGALNVPSFCCGCVRCTVENARGQSAGTHHPLYQSGAPVRRVQGDGESSARPPAKRASRARAPKSDAPSLLLGQHGDLARVMQLIEYPANTVVCKQGQETDFFILLGGTAEVGLLLCWVCPPRVHSFTH